MPLERGLQPDNETAFESASARNGDGAHVAERYARIAGSALVESSCGLVQSSRGVRKTCMLGVAYRLFVRRYKPDGCLHSERALREAASALWPLTWTPQ